VKDNFAIEKTIIMNPFSVRRSLGVYNIHNTLTEKKKKGEKDRKLGGCHT